MYTQLFIFIICLLRFEQETYQFKPSDGGPYLDLVIMDGVIKMISLTTGSE